MWLHVMSASSAEDKKGSVLVTGFGPFGSHEINASWVAVQELYKLWNKLPHKFDSYTLHLKEVPVVYDYVTEHLAKIYDDCTPTLCVHVGVSPYNIVKIERRGKNRDYLHKDIQGTSPLKRCCVEGGPDSISTSFDLESVCGSLPEENKVRVGISEDAGRYLCDFIYYKSLNLGRCPVVFVHVPPLNQPYSAEELGQALKDIITVLLTKLNSVTV